MPTYLYQYTDETGGTFEFQQGIKAAALTEHNARPVKRLIAGAPRFNLIAGDSGGWADQGYSKPEAHRQAEQTLGRKLHKPV